MAEIKRILVSQPKPAILEKSPFFELANKYDLEVDYRPLIEVKGVTPKEFRSQRVEILAHMKRQMMENPSFHVYFFKEEFKKCATPSSSL